MPAPVETTIWLPGRGDTSLGELAVDKAVQEYDPLLRFGRNNDNGQWCIFLIKRGEAPLPVLGFDRVPHPDDALRRLYQSDALRRGNEILDEVIADRERHDAALELAAKEADAQLAEAGEWALREQGKTPHKRVYIGKNHRVMGGWS